METQHSVGSAPESSPRCEVRLRGANSLLHGGGAMACAGFTEALSVDYALGSAATASSSEGGYVAANAVDGDDDAPSRWASLFNDDESLTLDLGAVRPLCEARLKWEAAHAATYELQRLDEVSGNWTTLVAVNGTEGWQTVPLDTRARHVRM